MSDLADRQRLQALLEKPKAAPNFLRPRLSTLPSAAPGGLSTPSVEAHPEGVLQESLSKIEKIPPPMPPPAPDTANPTAPEPVPSSPFGPPGSTALAQPSAPAQSPFGPPLALASGANLPEQSKAPSLASQPPASWPASVPDSGRADSSPPQKPPPSSAPPAPERNWKLIGLVAFIIVFLIAAFMVIYFLVRPFPGQHGPSASELSTTEQSSLPPIAPSIEQSPSPAPKGPPRTQPDEEKSRRATPDLEAPRFARSSLRGLGTGPMVIEDTMAMPFVVVEP